MLEWNINSYWHPVCFLGDQALWCRFPCSQHRPVFVSFGYYWSGSTHWGRDKMVDFSQTTLSNAFSWMKILEFRLKLHWSLLLRVLFTIFQHWFWLWLGAHQATSHYLNQYWLDHWRIYASLGLNELTGSAPLIINVLISAPVHIDGQQVNHKFMQKHIGSLSDVGRKDVICGPSILKLKLCLNDIAPPGIRKTILNKK